MSTHWSGPIGALCAAGRALRPSGVAAWLALGLLMPSPAHGDDEGIAHFENHVRPLLLAHCVKCHGPAKQENGLRVDGRAALLAGGQSGPALVPGKVDESLVWRVVSGQGEVTMPPEEALSAAEQAALRTWIAAGAPWPAEAAATATLPANDWRQHWSFQPLRAVEPPDIADAPDALPIDRFLFEGLQVAGLVAARPASREQLLRRASYDLTGLPPTLDEQQAFLTDNSADAYARLIERLLGTRAYGERWGRHWLDVVRYADTAGETADYPAPLAYRYRDYVIQAVADDKPWDQFLREQVAGDLLAAEGPRVRYAEQVLATGYLAISRRFGFDSENYHHLTLQDTIDTLGQSVLGLSLGCARCHDHKFDPVSMRDYYALYGIFASTRYAFPGSEEKKRPYDLVPLVPPDEAEPLRQAQERELARLEADLKRLDEELKTATAERHKTKLQVLRDETAAARDRLAGSTPYAVAYAVQEGTPQDAPIQLRGEPERVGEVVPRRFLELLGGDALPADERGSGRRQLADWLTRASNPLTPRVLVNRVWQQHFGRGLVRTVNDFGLRGERPTHPELLDYLAGRLVEGGWSLKELHREIMQTAAYRQTASDGPSRGVDPENRWLARFSRRPLSAEELRDTLLMLGGNLDGSPAAPHAFPPVQEWNFSQHTPFFAVYPSQHRTVYLMTQRLKRHPYLALFDGPDTNASTGERSRSTVATQALYLLNDAFVHEQSLRFADRLLAESDAELRLRRAFGEALVREPTREEIEEARAFLQEYVVALGAGAQEAARQSWAALARTLFARNEFLYVE